MDKEKKNTEKKINVQNLIENLVRKAQIALDEMMKLNQEDIDKIVESMAKAGLDNHIKLAQMAVEETKKGIFEDKITKNIFATEYIYNDIKYKNNLSSAYQQGRRSKDCSDGSRGFQASRLRGTGKCSQHTN